MDILSTRQIEVTNLALSGLMERQKAISSNAANVMTPGYQRKEVTFESQLKEIIDKDNIRKDIRAINGQLPVSKAQPQIPETGFIPASNDYKALPAEQLKFLSQKDYNQFDPEIVRDFAQFDVERDNNVSVEKEMMDMARTSIQYNVLATLEARSFNGLSEIIKSGGN